MITYNGLVTKPQLVTLEYPPKERVPNGKFSGKETCGKTMAVNGRQHHEELLVDVDGREILKMPEPNAGCRAIGEEKALEFTTLKSITVASIVPPQHLETLVYENL